MSSTASLIAAHTVTLEVAQQMAAAVAAGGKDRNTIARDFGWRGANGRRWLRAQLKAHGLFTRTPATDRRAADTLSVVTAARVPIAPAPADLVTAPAPIEAPAEPPVQDLPVDISVDALVRRRTEIEALSSMELRKMACRLGFRKTLDGKLTASSGKAAILATIFAGA